MGSKRQSLLVVDFDNTLFFTDECVRRSAKDVMDKYISMAKVRKLDKATKRKILYRAFSVYWQYATPNESLLKLLKSRQARSKIIILTARHESYRKWTEMLLERDGVFYNKLILRPRSQQNRHDQEWKLMELKKIAKSKPNAEIQLFEDKDDNIEYIGSGMAGTNFVPYFVSKNGISEVRLQPHGFLSLKKLKHAYGKNEVKAARPPKGTLRQQGAAQDRSGNLR